MKNESDIQKEIIKQAVALHVIDPEDITAAGGERGQDPAQITERLRGEGYISREILGALSEYVVLRPSQFTIEPHTPSATPAKPVLASNNQTLEPSESRGHSPSLNLSGQTVDPADDRERARGSGLNLSGQTVDPADDRESARGSGLNLSGQTVDPADDRERARGSGLNFKGQTVDPADDRERARGSGLNFKGQTLDPSSERSPGVALNASRETGLNLGSATQAPGTLAPDEGTGRLNVNRQTSDGFNRGVTSAGASSGTIDGRHHTAEVLGGIKPETVDLSSLVPDQRQMLEEAAFARIAIRRGYLSREWLTGLPKDPGVRIEDRAVAEGLLSADQALEIFNLRQTKRFVCAECFGVLESPVQPCAVCGHRNLVSIDEARIAEHEQRPEHGVIGFEPGGTFAGYEILNHVAEGGMGVVFRARQTKLNRIVALKVLRGGNLASKSRRRRFLQEAEAAAALRHTSIVPVHEIDEVMGYPFYTMDFVEGDTLDNYVKKAQKTPKECADLLRQLADGVQHLHLNGIVHRDLKPDNILVGEDGVPKIIDFGIAKKLASAEGPGRTKATLEGDVLGTPHYMSPEQAAGRVSEVDVRSDVYALGTILYELLTGAPPWYDLPSARLVVAIQEDDPDPVRKKRPDVEADLEYIIQKAMAKERERRYASSAHLSEDLDRYLKGLPIEARPASIAYRLKKFVRRNAPAVAAVSLVVLGLASFAGFRSFKARQLRLQIDGMLAEAEDLIKHDRLDPAAALNNQVLALEDGNRTAKANLLTIDDRRNQLKKIEAATHESELAKKEAQRKEIEAELKAEVASRDTLSEKEAREKTFNNAMTKAQGFLAAAVKQIGENDPQKALTSLLRSNAALPEDERAKETRTKVDTRTVEVLLTLAENAVKTNDVQAGDSYLKQTSDVGDASVLQGFAAKIAAVNKELEQIKSGRIEVQNAQRIAQESTDPDKWLQVRQILEVARKKHVAEADIRDIEKQANETCAAKANELLDDARRANNATPPDPATALALANKAQRYDSNAGAQVVIDLAERIIVSDTQRKAATLAATSLDRAIAAVQDAEKLLQDSKKPERVALLKRERRARERLRDNPKLAEQFAFVPELVDFGVKTAFYMSRTEVTNEEWKAFVDGNGYGTPDLWTGKDDKGKEVQSLVPSFVDTTGKPGPRTWTNGGFGDPQNARLPVRGVTVHEARAYARWRSKQDGTRLRLPTDLEWEVAAGWNPQSGALNKYPSGGDAPRGVLAATDAQPHLVGSTSADCSALGVWDMTGNVIELVERPGSPGLKGASFASPTVQAAKWAALKMTGNGANPPPVLLAQVGCRMALEIEEN